VVAFHRVAPLAIVRPGRSSNLVLRRRQSAPPVGERRRRRRALGRQREAATDPRRDVAQRASKLAPSSKRPRRSDPRIGQILLKTAPLLTSLQATSAIHLATQDDAKIPRNVTATHRTHAATLLQAQIGLHELELLLGQLRHTGFRRQLSAPANRAGKPAPRPSRSGGRVKRATRPGGRSRGAGPCLPARAPVRSITALPPPPAVKLSPGHPRRHACSVRSTTPELAVREYRFGALNPRPTSATTPAPIARRVPTKHWRSPDINVSAVSHAVARHAGSIRAAESTRSTRVRYPSAELFSWSKPPRLPYRLGDLPPAPSAAASTSPRPTSERAR